MRLYEETLTKSYQFGPGSTFLPIFLKNFGNSHLSHSSIHKTNPIVRNRSRNQLEKIARDLIDIRVSASETKITAVKNVHLDLLRDLPNLDIFEFAEYLDEETNAIARNMQADLDHIDAPDIAKLVLCQVQGFV